MVVNFLTASMIRYMESDYLFEQMEMQSRNSFALLAATAIDAVITEDRPLLETIISQTIKKAPDMVGLSVTNESGEVLAKWLRKDVPAQGNIRQYTYPIEYEAEIFGDINIKWDIEPIYEEIDHHVGEMRLFMSSMLIVLTGLIIFLMHWLAVRPVRQINNHLITLADGSRPAPIHLSASSELMRLAESANNLTTALQQRDEREMELLQTREELEAARDAALSASRAKSGFLATMSHEIRTPLNAVLGILGLLKETPLNAEQHHFVHTGRVSGELLLTIINDILDFSKMEADRMKLEQTSFNLHKLLSHTIDLLQHQASKKSLSLNLMLVEDLPVYVKGDPDRLRQILLNLINNAIKFTPTGGVTIKASATSGKGDIIKLCCAVEDTGVGISKEYHGSLFDKFTMADPSHSRTHEGTGLGLAICKHLVSLMHGNIEFSSELGIGSTFYFDIPMGLADKSECEAEPENEGSGQLPAANTRILLAEDNPANQMVVKMMLEYAGLQVDIVANGEEAVEAVRTIPYDIVLMDISMPRMDGMEATGIIRQLSGPENTIPIVAITAHALSGDKERFMAAGMNDFLTKPIDRTKVLQCIAYWTGSGDKLQQDEVPDKPMVAIDEGELLDESVLQQLARDTAPEIVPELVELYISDARKRVEIIQIALREHDLKTIEFEAHSIGSSAAAHGNMRLHYLARRVERLCQDGDEKQAIADAQALIPIAAESFGVLEEGYISQQGRNCRSSIDI
ncbi:MAG: response regulator [Gammaproteobacteria bacterium]|nr:response regulator [Gammaproteobacteria bacterium]